MSTNVDSERLVITVKINKLFVYHSLKICDTLIHDEELSLTPGGPEGPHGQVKSSGVRQGKIYKDPIGAVRVKKVIHSAIGFPH